MYVPLHVGVFFPLLFFLKVAFACIDGMYCNFILQLFSSVFSHIKKNRLGEEEFQSIAASRFPGRVDLLQPYNENSASLFEKLRNKIFRFAISGHLLFKCYVR